MNRVDKLDYINNLYQKAYRCKTRLDKPRQCFQGDCKDLAAREYKNYLQEIVKNPVASIIAMRDTLKEHPFENINNVAMNIQELEKQPEIDKLVKKIEQIDLSHKNTLDIRSKIIAENRISLNSVTPKLKGFKKFCYKLKCIF